MMNHAFPALLSLRLLGFVLNPTLFYSHTSLKKLDVDAKFGLCSRGRFSDTSILRDFMSLTTYEKDHLCDSSLAGV